MVIIVNRIRDLREDHDLTQQELADMLGCSQATYSRYETGDVNVPVDILKRLSQFYKVSIDYIVGLSDRKWTNLCECRIDFNMLFSHTLKWGSESGVYMERIRNLREDKDLNQTKMAELLNCSQTTYSRYETGDLNIPIDSLTKLAIFFNTSIDYLIGLTDEKKPYKRIIKSEGKN